MEFYRSRLHTKDLKKEALTSVLLYYLARFLLALKSIRQYGPAIHSVAGSI